MSPPLLPLVRLFCFQCRVSGCREVFDLPLDALGSPETLVEKLQARGWHAVCRPALSPAVILPMCPACHQVARQAHEEERLKLRTPRAAK